MAHSAWIKSVLAHSISGMCSNSGVLNLHHIFYKALILDVGVGFVHLQSIEKTIELSID